MTLVANLWQQLLQSDLCYYYKRDKVAIVQQRGFPDTRADGAVFAIDCTV